MKRLSVDDLQPLRPVRHLGLDEAFPNPLPLGTVVRLYGSAHRTMIVARCLSVRTDDGLREFDYGGCPWPEGLKGDQLLYFDHKAVISVASLGVTGGEEDIYARGIRAMWRRDEPFSVSASDRLSASTTAPATAAVPAASAPAPPPVSAPPAPSGPATATEPGDAR